MSAAHIASPAGCRWTCVGVNVWHGPELYKVQYLDRGEFELIRSGVKGGRSVFEQVGAYETLDEALVAADQLVGQAKDLSPTHRTRCACGSPKALGFAFCVGCTRTLGDRGIRVKSLEEALSPKYDQAVEALRQAGRVER